MHLLYTLHWLCSWPSPALPEEGWVGTTAKGETEAYNPRNAHRACWAWSHSYSGSLITKQLFPALLPLSVQV